MDDRTEGSIAEEVLTEAAEAEAAVLDAGDLVAAEALPIRHQASHSTNSGRSAFRMADAYLRS